MKFKIPDPSASSLVRFHFFMMILWGSLAVPTIIWWNQSILWVAFMSLYANFVGHFGAMDAAKAQESIDEK